MDATGRPLPAQIQEEVTYVAHLEVLAPQRGERIMDLTAQQQVDPFARSAEGDPTPELTQLFEALLREAWGQLAGHLAGRTAPLSAVRVRYVPPPSTEASGLEAEVQQLARIQFVNPELDERQSAKLAALPSGLFVEEPGTSGRLEKGDLVTGIDGGPALPQRFERALARGTCSLVVLRAAQPRELACP
jgi:hypothetical protein